MQQALIAGDTLKFTTQVPAYPASAGWTLTYRLVPQSSGSAIPIIATPLGEDYQVEVSAADTADWAPGAYSWAAYVTLGAERYTVDGWVIDGELVPSGSALTIKPDPGIVSAYDNRSFARRSLEAIEAVLENRASLDQEEYTINGRSLRRTPVDELWMLRSRFQAEVRNEDARARLAAGLGATGKLQVRF